MGADSVSADHEGSRLTSPSSFPVPTPFQARTNVVHCSKPTTKVANVGILLLYLEQRQTSYNKVDRHSESEARLLALNLSHSWEEEGAGDNRSINLGADLL